MQHVLCTHARVALKGKTVHLQVIPSPTAARLADSHMSNGETVRDVTLATSMSTAIMVARMLEMAHTSQKVAAQTGTVEAPMRATLAAGVETASSAMAMVGAGSRSSAAIATACIIVRAIHTTTVQQGVVSAGAHIHNHPLRRAACEYRSIGLRLDESN